MASLVPNQLDKMKVLFATLVFNHEVGCGLKYLLDKEGRKEEYLTAAWLIEVISHCVLPYDQSTSCVDTQYTGS